MFCLQAEFEHSMMENLSVLLWLDLFSKCIQEWIWHFIKTLHIITEHSHNFRSKPYYWELCLIFILKFFCICLRPSFLSPSQMVNNSFAFCTACILKALLIRNRPFRFFQVLHISWYHFCQVIFSVVFCSAAFSSCPSTFLPKAGNKWDETVNAPLLTPGISPSTQLEYWQ